MAGPLPRAPVPSPFPPPNKSSKNPGWLPPSIHRACHYQLANPRKKDSTFGSTRRRRRRSRAAGGGEGRKGAMMPRGSHPAVHPDPAPPPPPPAPAPAQAAAQGQGQQAAAPALAPAPAQAAAANVQGPNAPPPGVQMRDFPGKPGTRAGLGLRLAQAFLAAAALASMLSADDFASITSFRYLVPAAALQCLWCLALAVVDVYALLVGRSFRTARALGVFIAGDWITGSLTLSAASAAAGITILIHDDLEYCYESDCPRFMAATAMAFLSWFALAPCCILNLGSVVYKLQRP